MSGNPCVSVGRAGVVLTLLIACVSPVRAQNAPGQANAADQQLDAILQQWFMSSQQVQVLNGEHRRYVYDYVFGTEKRAMGKFFYTAPDKGRIDLSPNLEGKDGTSSKTHPLTRKKVKLTIGPDQPERWICDGIQVLQIDDVSKSGQQYPIPPEARGANIMDGPLPFLFGMPPAKAKARYHLRLLGVTKEAIDLLVRPKLKKDAANYQWARVRIERATMLPAAVQIIDPSGNKETVYTFPKIDKNPKAGILKGLVWWKDKDPFRPDLKGYDIQLADVAPREALAAGAEARRPQPRQPVAPRPAGPQQDQKLVPSVIGLNYEEAKRVLEQSGFAVKFQKGDAAVRSELVYRVQRQIPGEKKIAKPGDVVWLTLYTPQVQQTGGTTPALSKAEVPVVTGMYFRDAEKLLKEAGYNVKFRRGVVARKSTEIFFTYDQVPKAGAELARGNEVTLILFTKPSTTPAPK